MIYFANGNAPPLNGRDFYSATFTKDDLPDAHVQYFWSVIYVDAVNVRVIPNAKNRFLLNKQSQLEYGTDGSPTLYFAPQKPDDAPENNWLPTPAGQRYVPTWRSYAPDQATVAGNRFPPELRQE